MVSAHAWASARSCSRCVRARVLRYKILNTDPWPVVIIIMRIRAYRKTYNKRRRIPNKLRSLDQQTLKPDDDYVLPHQRLWTFDVLVCPLSVTERFLVQPLVCGTVFHRSH